MATHTEHRIKCAQWLEGVWVHSAVPALLCTPLQDLQVSPQSVTGIPEELITVLVLLKGEKRSWLRSLAFIDCD